MEMTQFAGNAADAFGGDPFNDAQQAKSTASDLFVVTETLKTRAAFAERTGNSALMEKIQELARQAIKALGEFVKKAIELAVYKMVIELCAMVIDSLMGVLKKKNNKIEISNSAVRYVGDSAVAAAGATQASGAGDMFNPNTYSSMNSKPFW